MTSPQRTHERERHPRRARSAGGGSTLIRRPAASSHIPFLTPLSHRPADMTQQEQPLSLSEHRVLAVNNMSVRFTTSERTVDAVRDLSFHIDRSEVLANVGESGSGKSVSSLAIMRLVDHGGGRNIQGTLAFRRGQQVIDLAKARETVMRSICGAEIAMALSCKPTLLIADELSLIHI